MARLCVLLDALLSTLLDAPTIRSGAPAHRGARGTVGSVDIHARAGTASVPLAVFLRFLAPLEPSETDIQALDMNTDDDATGKGQWTVGCDSRFITAHAAKLLGCKRAKGRKGLEFSTFAPGCGYKLIP